MAATRSRTAAADANIHMLNVVGTVCRYFDFTDGLISIYFKPSPIIAAIIIGSPISARIIVIGFINIRTIVAGTTTYNRVVRYTG